MASDRVSSKISDRKVDSAQQVLENLHRVILTHPVACQALFSALRAEGLAFMQTERGRVLAERLSRSELIHRARMAWEASSRSILDETPAGVLPSTYLDALFLVARTDRAVPQDEYAADGNS